MDKWVRVMADHSSDGLWDRDGVMFGAEDLPVSNGLSQRLAAWCLQYEDNTDYLPDDHPDRKPFNYAPFATDGREIALAIKAELPDWTVIYFDEAQLEAAMAASNTADRTLFEREV
jgi:hypothetical protein